ncbi:MAG: substrate-binding domain-containing protein, partial [Bifidobacteriaceae bacterium]|nr:substrate-binding domain-containing protein [Bifidobacteriaceae bacterium]
ELQSYNIQGIITLSHTIPSKELASYNIPIVSIERESQYISSVDTDNYLGAVQATSHLIKNNCDILIHINSFVTDTIPAYKRINGFINISKDSDVPYEVYQRDFGNSYEEISKNLTLLFEEIDKKYTSQRKGVFLSNDTYANIFLNAIFQKYNCLPDEYKIIGFDDSPIASEAILPLSSIQQNIPTITNTALDILQDLIKEHRNTKGKHQTIVHREIAPKLIKRQTTI